MGIGAARGIGLGMAETGQLEGGAKNGYPSAMSENGLSNRGFSRYKCSVERQRKTLPGEGATGRV